MFEYFYPLGKTKGDWNCDGIVEKEHKTGIKCSDHLITDQCATISGFMGDPPCSTQDYFVQCAAPTVGLNCIDGAISRPFQGCM
jgi:hypothetical protein